MRTPCLSAVAAVVLLATLPTFGTGGQAWAGFVNDSVTDVESPEKPSWASVVNDLLRGDVGGAARPSADAATPAIPKESSPFPTPRNDGPKTKSGMGSPTTTPPGSAAGAGQTFGPVVRVSLERPTESGRLFLVEIHFDPPPSGARLFRPPRD